MRTYIVKPFDARMNKDEYDLDLEKPRSKIYYSTGKTKEPISTHKLPCATCKHNWEIEDVHNLEIEPYIPFLIMNYARTHFVHLFGV